MIGISTNTFDLDGAKVFHRHDPLPVSAKSRRVTRTATLNAGVSIYDGGSVEGDRDIDINLTSTTEADKTYCHYILDNYSEVTVSTNEGAFLCCPVSCGFDTRGNLKFKLYVKEKIS